MPTIKQSQKVDRSKLAPVDSPMAMPAPAVLPPPSPFAPSPFMACSLPPIAAGLDQYIRQFYNSSQNPQQRILPVNLK